MEKDVGQQSLDLEDALFWRGEFFVLCSITESGEGACIEQHL
jgi:hypothetical protein